MYRIIGCIAFAITGLAMPPGSEEAQHGQAIQQSIIQFIGQSQQFGHFMHGFMHGSMHIIGQSTMVVAFGSQT